MAKTKYIVKHVFLWKGMQMISAHKLLDQSSSINYFYPSVGVGAIPALALCTGISVLLVNQTAFIFFCVPKIKHLHV